MNQFISQLDNNQTRNLNRLTYIAKRGRQKTPLHYLQKTIYRPEVRGENENPWEGDGEGGGRNFSSIPQVSMARDRRTNNPSASTIIHIKNRLVILLVNLRSWHKHPHGSSVSSTFGRGIEGRFFMSRVYFCYVHFFKFFSSFFKRARRARHTEVQLLLALTRSVDRCIVTKVYFLKEKSPTFGRGI